MRLGQFSNDEGRPLALTDLAASDAKLFLSITENEILDMACWIGEARAKTLAARKARKSNP